MAAPQATPGHAVASAKNDGALPAAGFAQALFAAGLSDPISSLPSPLAANTTGTTRNPKSAKQPPSKEPSKDNGKKAVAVPVATSLQATLAPPLRILPFSRDTETHEPAPSSPREATVPAETTAADATVNPASGTHADKPQPGAGANVDSPREISKPPAPENQPAAPSGELAFAARVQPTTAPSPDPAVSPRPPQHDITAPEQAKKAIEKDAADPATVQPVAAGAEASLSSQGQHAQYANAEGASQPRVDVSAPAAPAAPPKPVETKVPELQPKAAPGPLKDLSLQVSQPGEQKVEVRVVQQSGELRVAVRTGDADLAHGMQQGLSDLVGRLQENGFRAEAWRPGGAAVQAGPVFEARTSPGSSQNGDSQSNSGGSHQQQEQRRQHQSQRPGWVEELENTIAGSMKSQGVTYGIGS